MYSHNYYNYIKKCLHHTIIKKKEKNSTNYKNVKPKAKFIIK